MLYYTTSGAVLCLEATKCTKITNPETSQPAALLKSFVAFVDLIL